MEGRGMYLAGAHVWYKVIFCSFFMAGAAESFLAQIVNKSQTTRALSQVLWLRKRRENWNKFGSHGLPSS